MYCRYCAAAMAEGETVCPACGKDNESPKKENKTLTIILSALLCAVLLAALVLAVLWGTYGDALFQKQESDKDSTAIDDGAQKPNINYTVDDAVLEQNWDIAVATLGESSLTNRQLQVFYWMHIYNYGYYYDVDFTQPLNEQVMDEETGKTWQQYFLESALQSWHQYQAVQQLAQEAGYTLPQEFQEELNSLQEKLEESAKEANFESAEAMLINDFGKGITIAEYKKYFELLYEGSMYFSELVDKLETTQEELEAYYTANSASLQTQWGVTVTKETGKIVDVCHILIMPEEETDAAWEACRQKAQGVYDQWLAGEATEESFQAIAQTSNEDSNCLYEDVTKGVMVEAFDNWCMDESRKYGDHGLVKTEYGYHIIFFVDSEVAWERVCRDGVLSEKADTLLKDILEENPMEADYDKIVLSDVNVSGN